MAIGYACINIGSQETKLSSIRIKDATDENLRKIISKNLDALEEIIKYNINNNIKLFRISSDIIPLGSHTANTIDWSIEFKERLSTIGAAIKDSKMRVSMHPGQYTVLNSINSDVAKRAVEDLDYHCKFLDCLDCDKTCKIILHIGGVYGDKVAAINRFINNYKKLSSNIKKRLVIENDDKSYTVEDVLLISEKAKIPVIYDVFHHELNNPDTYRSKYEWLDLCNKTWTQNDGKQKIHYSQANASKTRGAHSNYINAELFLNFYNGLHSKDIDIMLEVKDKNLSAVKCNLLTNENIKIQTLEKEWSLYKYFVLSHSAKIYNDIRTLLKNKFKPDAYTFYQFIEEALLGNEDVGAQINAAQHIWGYVSKKACQKDSLKFEKLIDQYRIGKLNIQSIKNFLFKLAKEQSMDYLLDSLYFYI